MSEPEGGANKNKALSLLSTFVSVGIPIIGFVTATVAGGFKIWEENATQPVAGYTVLIRTPSRVNGDKSAPGQTIVQYEARNPGPATLDNVDLRAVVHKKQDGNMPSVRQIGAAKKDEAASEEGVTYTAYPHIGGDRVKLGADQSIGLLMIADSEDWQPNEVTVNWGNARSKGALGPMPSPSESLLPHWFRWIPLIALFVTSAFSLGGIALLLRDAICVRQERSLPKKRSISVIEHLLCWLNLLRDLSWSTFNGCSRKW